MFPCSQAYFSFKPCEQHGRTDDIIILYSFPKKHSSRDKVRLKTKIVMEKYCVLMCAVHSININVHIIQV